MRKPTPMPRWLTTTMGMSSLDVVLVFALSLRLYGTPNALRRAVVNLRGRVCMEHQPKMKRLAKLNDHYLMRAALQVVNEATDAIGILPGEVFEPTPPSAPVCHYRPMLLGGVPGDRHWVCERCHTTKNVEYL